MDFGTKKTMKDEPLWLTRFLTVGILEKKLVLVSLIISLASQAVVYVTEIYILYTDPKQFKKFLPWMLVKLFGMVNCLVVLKTRHISMGLWQHLDRWTIDSAGKATREEIERKIRLQNLFVVMSLWVAAVPATAFSKPSPADNEFFFLCYFLHERKFRYSTLICSSFKFLAGPVTFTMMFFPYLVNYVTQHINYQSHLLRAHAGQIIWEYENVDEVALLQDQKYQNVVNQRIIFCVKRHVELLRFSETMHNLFMRNYFVPISVFGFLLGMGFGMLILELQQKNYENTTWLGSVIVLVFTLLAIMLFTSLMYCGQEVENEMIKGIYSMVSVFISLRN